MKLKKSIAFLMSLLMVFTLIAGALTVSAVVTGPTEETKKIYISQTAFNLNEKAMFVISAADGDKPINNLMFVIKDAEGKTIASAKTVNGADFALAIIPEFKKPGATKLIVDAVSLDEGGETVIANYEIPVTVVYSVPSNNISVTENGTNKIPATSTTVNIYTYAGVFSMLIPTPGVKGEVVSTTVTKSTPQLIYQRIKVTVPDTTTETGDVILRAPVNTLVKADKYQFNMIGNTSAILKAFPFGGSIEAVIPASESNLETHLLISTEFEHVYTKYAYDENSHWQVCDGCGAKGEVKAHEFNSKGACKVCDYKLSDTQFTLSFDTNGGNAFGSLTREKGKRLNITEAIPTKPGYKFEGWYYDKEFTKAADVVVLESDVTVYAKWSVEKLPFNDVYTNDWFVEDVAYVYNKGIMTGATESIFNPAGATTRAMVVTMLYRLAGEPAFMNDNIFSDVKAGSYYEKAVIWAQGKGIVTGKTANTFAPDETVTREQLVAMLYRFAKYVEKDTKIGETNILSYNDIQSVASYAVESFQWAISTGLIQGDDAHNILPKAPASRAQVAAMMHRLAELG